MSIAASHSQDLSKKSDSGGSIWNLSLIHMTFHFGKNAQTSMSMQPCFEIFRHKYLDTNGKQMSNVHVHGGGEGGGIKTVFINHHVLLPCKT